MKPVIGIMMRKDGDYHEGEIVKSSYLKAIQTFGGLPLLLPYELVKEDASFLLDHCDGILFPGGEEVMDIDVAFYEEAVKRKMPILGICLGMQMMASFPVKERLKYVSEIIHKCVEKDAHLVYLEKEKELSKIFGNHPLTVNSHHRYGVVDAGNLQIAALSEDGIIEAVEGKDTPFQIGVQWHPEDLLDEEREQNLFSTFIKNAQTYAKKKK